jgi:hypothetical protein
MLCPIMVQSRTRGTANDPIPPPRYPPYMEPYPLPSVACISADRIWLRIVPCRRHPLTCPKPAATPKACDRRVRKSAKGKPC